MAATTVESMNQFERDLRSANQPWKRGKDATVKWSFGKRPLSGRLDETEKSRPTAKLSDRSKPSTYERAIRQQNINKPERLVYKRPNGRIHGKGMGHEEMSDVSRSIADLAPMYTPRREREYDMTDYMFPSDVVVAASTTDAPNRPLALDIFVKPVSATTRDGTERLVEKEYEVVDVNGDTLKGRKARRNNLRKSGADFLALIDQVDDNEVDGFELV